MKELTHTKLCNIELEILKKVAAICDKEGFRYSLCGGTLLGAVRHGGFIPWDDDIDIFMPRPDYNRFIQYCSSHKTGFTLLCHELNDNYGYLFAKAMDMNTKLVETVSNPHNIDLGVFIDIFPIDGVGNTEKEASKSFSSTNILRELLVASNWSTYFRSKTRPIYYEPIRLAFYLLSRIFSQKSLITNIEKKYAKYDFDSSEYVACVCGSYRTKEIVKSDIYKQFDVLKFENQEFCVIKEYDAYLSSIYGDYMQLPPPEKRVTHHTFKAFYRNP